MVVTGAFVSMGNSSSDGKQDMVTREALSWQLTRHPSLVTRTYLKNREKQDKPQINTDERG
jgi:hypothetical protein